MSTASRNCPLAASRSARWWPTDLPIRGQEFCPPVVVDLAAAGLGGQLIGVTPVPARACARRTESPLVWARWA